MPSIKNVTVVGAAGSLGTPVLDALVKSGKFNITAVVRSAGKATFDHSVKVVEADFTSLESLTKAFQGQDAVVSTVGHLGVSAQILFIDAAVAAGVQRFIPSEFGSNLGNPKNKTFPTFKNKVVVNDHIENKARANPGFSYTLVRNGAFLDWGLERGFLLDWQSGKPRIYDSGDQEFSTTSLETVGRSIVGVLSNPEETKNRPVYIQDTTITQNRLLAMVKKLAPEIKLQPVYESTAEMYKAANEKIANGDYSVPVLTEYLFVSLFGEGCDGVHEKTDNKLLGIAGDKTDADIEAILKPMLDAAKKSA